MLIVFRLHFILRSANNNRDQEKRVFFVLNEVDASQQPNQKAIPLCLCSLLRILINFLIDFKSMLTNLMQLAIETNKNNKTKIDQFRFFFDICTCVNPKVNFICHFEIIIIIIITIIIIFLQLFTIDYLLLINYFSN